ncbi:MAG: addiction module protein [Gammaproteobacteria bacterium]|nr:addiction module protein [Gammaproteobacteria bacterium]
MPKLNEMPVEERLKLVQDLWDSIAADTGAIPVDPGHVDVVRERLTRYRSDGSRGEPVRTAVESIRNSL